MPASIVRRTSFSKPLAVSAMMGTVPASGLSRARIRRAASSPSMTGIRRSISTASKVQGAEASNRSRAFRPFSAWTPSAPSSSSRSRTISAFSGTSSATRIRRPSRETSAGAPAFPAAPGFPGSPAAGFAPSSAAIAESGKVTVKTEPTPFSLDTRTLPPTRSSRLLTAASPSPLPPKRVVEPPSSRAKRSKSCSRNSGLIPMPVSLTLHRSIRASGPVGKVSAEKLTTPGTSVYLTALSISSISASRISPASPM